MFFQRNRTAFQKCRLIPVCSIYIILLTVNFYDIPGMSFITVPRISLYINTRNSKLFQKILYRPRISGTHSFLFPENACNILVIPRCFILCMIYQIRINCFDLIISRHILCNLLFHFFQRMFHECHNFLNFLICIRISR